MTDSAVTLWDQALQCSERAEVFLAERDQVRIDILPEIIFHQDCLQETLEEVHKLEQLANDLALGFRCLFNESQKIFYSKRRRAKKLSIVGHKVEQECQRINDKIKLLYYEITKLNVSWKELLVESEYWHELAIREIRQANDLRNEVGRIKSNAYRSADRNQTICK